MKKHELLKGIQDEEERILFAKVLDLAEFCKRRYEPQFSDFLDMAKCARFQERLRNFRGITVFAFGGTAETERLMLGISLEDMEFSNEDFPIVALQIERKSKKFGQSDLSHRDYLGSILGLGIDRSKVGDIILSEDGDAVCFVKEDMADYILTNLDKVSRTAVKVNKHENMEIATQKRTQTKRVTVASLRLDAVLSEALNISRGKAQTLISGERVQVNWNVLANASAILKEGDMVSARGFGRFRLGEVGGKTKKDRTVVELEIYIS